MAALSGDITAVGWKNSERLTEGRKERVDNMRHADDNVSSNNSNITSHLKYNRFCTRFETSKLYNVITILLCVYHHTICFHIIMIPAYDDVGNIVKIQPAGDRKLKQ